MIIEPNQAIAAQLSWLTTQTFERLGFPVVAVVLAGPADCLLLEELELQCRRIDSVSERILIISMGSSEEAAQLGNPAWVYQYDGELAHRIGNMRGGSWAPHRPEPYWGSFADAAIRLLDLEPPCLPAVYLRFASKEGTLGSSSAVVVPMAAARPDAFGRFLRKLSIAAEEHEVGLKDMADFLVGEGHAGWLVERSTQVALDQVLGSTEWEPRPYNQDGEAERVQTTWDTIVMPARSAPAYNKIVAEAERFLAPLNSPTTTTLHRPDLALALRMAAIAWRMGDYGTVVRNVGVACEAMVSASLFHSVRGIRGVRLPVYLDRFDPDRDRLPIAGAEFNCPRHAIIGGVGGGTAPRTPWKAPTLAIGLGAFEHCLPEMDPGRIGRDGCAALLSVLREISQLRNPAAHGDLTSEKSADKAWSLLETLILSKQMEALAAIRTGFHHGSILDLAVVSRIVAISRPHYLSCIEEQKVAYQSLLERDVSCKKVLDSITPLRTAVGSLSLVLSKADLTFWDLMGARHLKDTCSGLPGWVEVQPHLAVQDEVRRRTKANSRLASRWFSTESQSDRWRLGDISRLLGVGPDEVRTVADIEAILANVEAILRERGVQPRPGEDWHAPIRARLEGWLEFNALYAGPRPVPDVIRQHASNWKDHLESLLRVKEVKMQAAQEECETASSIYACASVRLQDARRGARPACTCGRHEPLIP
jgi:hypothetical protein